MEPNGTAIAVDPEFGLSPLTSSRLYAGIMPLQEEPLRLALFADHALFDLSEQATSAP